MVEGHEKDSVIALFSEWKENVFPCLADLESESDVDSPSQQDISNDLDNSPSVKAVDLLLHQFSCCQLVIDVEKCSHSSTPAPNMPNVRMHSNNTGSGVHWR
jgi:hypothetical protein